MPGSLTRLAIGALFGFIRLSNLISHELAEAERDETAKTMDSNTEALIAIINAND